jgi:uridine kinase
MTPSVGPLGRLLAALPAIDPRHPSVVALDGRSGAGKSTLAAALVQRVEGLVIDGDDFHRWHADQDWDVMTPAERVDRCIDWRRQREVLTALRRGETASWLVHDWDADDGRPLAAPRTVTPRPLVVLEGTYSARPELADLIDLRVLVDAPAQLRRSRVLEREGRDEYETWEQRWGGADEHYFAEVMPPGAFDLELENAKTES